MEGVSCPSVELWTTHGMDGTHVNVMIMFTKPELLFFPLDLSNFIGQPRRRSNGSEVAHRREGAGKKWWKVTHESERDRGG